MRRGHYGRVVVVVTDVPLCWDFAGREQVSIVGLGNRVPVDRFGMFHFFRTGGRGTSLRQGKREWMDGENI